MKRVVLEINETSLRVTREGDPPATFDLPLEESDQARVLLEALWTAWRPSEYLDHLVRVKPPCPCGRPSQTRGLCSTCYRREIRAESLPRIYLSNEQILGAIPKTWTPMAKLVDAIGIGRSPLGVRLRGFLKLGLVERRRVGHIKGGYQYRRIR